MYGVIAGVVVTSALAAFVLPRLIDYYPDFVKGYADGYKEGAYDGFDKGLNMGRTSCKTDCQGKVEFQVNIPSRDEYELFMKHE